MLVYIITFIIVELLAHLIPSSKEKTKWYHYMFLFSIIFILSLVGGLRSINIGTDVKIYGERWFRLATNSYSFNFYRTIVSTTDIGYLMINYLVSRISSNINIFLFVHQVICNSIIVITLYKYREKCSFSLSLLLYLCFFYCRTFNILRQAVALSIVFAAIINLIENKNKKFIIYVLISSLFHFTAIFSLLMFPIKKICDIESKKKYIYIILILIGMLLITINIETTIKILYSYGIVNKRIYNYLFEYVNKNAKTIGFEFLIKSSSLLIILLNKNALKKLNKENYFLIITTIIEYILFQVRTKIMYADRISLYFGYTMILILPQVVKVPNKGKQKLLYYILILSIALIYWYYKYIYSGSCEVYPYEFYWNS